MTAADITTLVRIHFSHKGIKLFKNEPHRKLIWGKWKVVKGLGFPAGSPDLTGWDTYSGQFVGCEIKTINDKLSSKQKQFLDKMVLENCEAYVAYEQADESIVIKNWEDGSIEVINEKNN